MDPNSQIPDVTSQVEAAGKLVTKFTARIVRVRVAVFSAWLFAQQQDGFRKVYAWIKSAQGMQRR